MGTFNGKFRVRFKLLTNIYRPVYITRTVTFREIPLDQSLWTEDTYQRIQDMLKEAIRAEFHTDLFQIIWWQEVRK